ncbi:negative regulator of flagellin synthesis FlgM [Evansella caseinilytica]|uniref:Negative regulator of flagellin synthesis n=1 Tax=Evansella caseinilytica TaxID=1503961 RepID=A0A1H3S5G4_9BACI|nr:flagellar biosynthesis anti-sigma factor FlgM [Evansella caseinilytica]SDZ33343.1 negative regulator of flagellin synthesis FlgM [Evansella caseinilytica]
MKIYSMHSMNIYRKQQEWSGVKSHASNSKRDEVNISAAAKKMQDSSKITQERQEKLEKIKAEIDSGTYKVNAQEVARKFYEFWSE